MSILNDLNAVWDKLEAAKPITYYATSEQVTPGQVFTIKANRGFPELFLFHPDDFARMQKELTRHCRLMHIREWTPTPTDIEQAFLDVLKEMNNV